MPRGRAYRFVEAPTGQNPTSREFQRTVRSHAARASHRGQRARRRALAREWADGQGVIVFDADPLDRPQDNDPSSSTTAVVHTRELTIASTRNQSDHENRALQRNQVQNPYRLAIDYLSGDTFSPLRHLPTYHKPYLPGIINHYIYNLTIPIPELDGNLTVPLFRATWLRVVFHDPVIFQIVVLFAATHYATFADPDELNHLYLELLSLKQAALLALIQKVQSEQTTPPTSAGRGRESRDTLIAAAAKMASYEAIFGTTEAFHLHMSTVTRLLRQQGGLAALGMDGFLARLLSFIDTNSSFLLGTNLYLGEFGLSNRMPHHQPFPVGRLDGVTPQVPQQISNTNVVNLERFIGFMNTGSEDNRGLPRS